MADQPRRHNIAVLPDPDKELQIDNFATVAALDRYFHSSTFAENPLGVTYDPEELCRRYETGEPIANLLHIPPMPEGKTPWDMLVTQWVALIAERPRRSGIALVIGDDVARGSAPSSANAAAGARMVGVWR